MASNQTVAIVGCGNMGSAILSGLLDATRSDPNPRISRFIVVTKTVESKDRLKSQFGQDMERIVLANDESLWAMKEADIIILGCKPHMAKDILGAEGMEEALSGKLLISVLAGKTPQVLESYISNNNDASPRPYVVRAMPNVAARIRQSMTIIEHNPSLPDELSDTLRWIFEQIGGVKVLASEVFDIGSLLVGSSMAIMTVALDGLLDGCVMEGMRRPEALELAAQSMLGLAEMLRQGECSPAEYRENVSSPKGGTITSLLTVEKAAVRGTFAQSIIDGTKKIQG
ncbi:hypothetical protein NW759_012195 [Fusarium solani]|uniref:Pyrroline-5-carboxylate reductase n=1 Tax=Fusarium solani TaxID=169388 RepID=A0A9P9KTQ0_FUSSL|nr:uncharacterized protein B0J15DRAFT_418778 [Fusarium solani]KAH7268309.1 hypothetical protein B0J15DRAFT_418778 [Fusarium solani]KAJ4211908.1 hypothetical protein NW759_012195 [Fusarium solani]